MSPIFTRDEMREALRRQDVPDEAIERAIAKEFGEPATPASADYLQVIGQPLTFPIRLTLPWSALCSDNDRDVGGLVRRGDKVQPRKVLTARYRAARDKTAQIGRAAMTVDGFTFHPFMRPLELRARVWVPDERLHDTANFAKCCHDGLEKVVYSNDKWLHRVVWERAGVDVDAPRADVEIRPL